MSAPPALQEVRRGTAKLARNDVGMASTPRHENPERGVARHDMTEHGTLHRGGTGNSETLQCTSTHDEVRLGMKCNGMAL